MKKVLAILLAAVMILGLAACGTINSTEVSVLWSDEGVVKIPNSLINAMERAMYIENISYKHYGAEGNRATQLTQAKDVIAAGCSALAVELIDPADAQSIVDLAKAADVPVVFFGCDVDNTVVSGYAKCAEINLNEASLGQVQGTMIKELLDKEKTFKAYDRNGDGKISFATFGDIGDTLKHVGENLTGVYEGSNVDVTAQVLSLYANRTDEKGDTVEMLLVESDELALDALKALQEKGFNSTKLKTHCIPLFTVGADADARDFTDTSTMTDEEKEALIFTAVNLVDAGKFTGVTMTDEDAIAESTAAVLRNLIKGNEITKGLDETLVVGKQEIAIPYTTYTG